MPAAETKAGTGFARIDAAHLPGVIYELNTRLWGAADTLAIHTRGISYDPPRGALTELALDTACITRVAKLLDQIGWQTEKSATVIGDPGFLRDIFEDMRKDAVGALEELRRDPGYWTDPFRARTNFEQALAGAEQVLRQLDSGRID